MALIWSRSHRSPAAVKQVHHSGFQKSSRGPTLPSRVVHVSLTATLLFLIYIFWALDSDGGNEATFPELAAERLSPSSRDAQAPHGEALSRQLRTLPPPFDALKSLLPQQTPTLLESAIVDLRHCSLERLHFGNFTRWAQYLVEEGHPRFRDKISKGELEGMLASDWNTTMVPEMILGLLEVFATHANLCDFSKMDLTISPTFPTQQNQLQRVPNAPANMARLAIVIVAFRDLDHLQRIVEAVHMPHHFIVIHLERSTPAPYVEAVQTRIVASYSNVVVLQFSAVTYRTDSVSFINFQIMNWLVHTVGVAYDYHITLGGAVFPLYSNIELATHLHQEKRHVWLGEMTHDGQQVRVPQYGYLQTKRLLTTYPNKYTQRIKRKVSEMDGVFYPTLPDFITTNMMYKTNSGNQAVYSFEVVKKLVISPQVKQLFGTAKYGCCCCLEERTWIAAMFIIGYGEEALQRANMWQVWGGNKDCTSSMNNAVLTTSEDTCFRLEDATEGSIVLNATVQQLRDVRDKTKAVYIRGNQVMDTLKEAKRRGFMFARKFRSDDAMSMELMERIKTEIHNN
jgi:hypothetical protein